MENDSYGNGDQVKKEPSSKDIKILGALKFFLDYSLAEERWNNLRMARRLEYENQTKPERSLLDCIFDRLKI